MKKIRHWILSHIIHVFVICSVLFATLIHVAFSINAPFDWMIAKWSAGDLLTYVSTIALALLAIWQNQKFKEENDLSQERLERLTVQANELTVVNKIIEIESSNLERLKLAYDEFSTACAPQFLSDIYVQAVLSDDTKLAILSGLSTAEKRIDDSLFLLCRELKTTFSTQQKIDEPISSIAHLYLIAKEAIEYGRKNPTAPMSNYTDKLVSARLKLITSRENHLQKKEKMLNQVIYGNLSLAEIKKLYHEELVLSQKDG